MSENYLQAGNYGSQQPWPRYDPQAAQQQQQYAATQQQQQVVQLDEVPLNGKVEGGVMFCLTKFLLLLFHNSKWEMVLIT